MFRKNNDTFLRAITMSYVNILFNIGNRCLRYSQSLTLVADGIIDLNDSN